MSSSSSHGLAFNSSGSLGSCSLKRMVMSSTEFSWRQNVTSICWASPLAKQSQSQEGLVSDCTDSLRSFSMRARLAGSSNK
eukprot:Skav217855  [mRNA]  locus=scaffold5889:44933:48142:+ [translate_table: standard]